MSGAPLPQAPSLLMTSPMPMRSTRTPLLVPLVKFAFPSRPLSHADGEAECSIGLGFAAEEGRAPPSTAERQSSLGRGGNMGTSVLSRTSTSDATSIAGSGGLPDTQN